jgi:hypothetical protein
MQVLQKSSQIFGRLHRLPNGRSKIFHEKLDWNASSKLRSSSLRNLNYKSRQNNTKVNIKPCFFYSINICEKLLDFKWKISMA